VIGERIQERFGGFSRRELVGMAAVAFLIVVGAVFWYMRSLPRPVTIQASGGGPGPAVAAAPSSPSPSPAVIVVDVAGWVRHPGVYEFTQGDRVIDAIERAGGGRRGADLTSINLAAILTDGEQIVVWRRGSGPGVVPGRSSIVGSGPSQGTEAMVNLNTATLDELESLPGIGPALGQRIIDYRDQHGPFRSVDELLNVSGIGEKRLADLRPKVTV
jgi:competence protein ComEA